MTRAAKTGLAGMAALAVLWLGACGGSQTIRVYVEPTYEQDRLQQLLALHPEVKVVGYPGTEDVSLRVEAVPEERTDGSPRAAIRARERRSRYEVFAVAEFLQVRNGHGGHARWVSSFADGIREDDVDEILFQVVHEAASQEHRSYQRPPREVERALHSPSPAS